MYERLDECPICKNKHYTNFSIIKDFSISGESFAIVECNNCHFKYTNPRPSLENSDKYYESEDYISHQTGSKKLTDRLYYLARQYTLRWKLNLVNKRVPKSAILDVGCGTGNFLNVCKKAGWQVFGVEHNEKARAAASTLLKQDIASSLDEYKKKQKFKAITLWHVLEHLHDLKGSMKLLKKVLDKDGKLFVAVPNAASYDAQYYKEHWAGYDVPRHLYHFDQTTFQTLLKKHKLKLLETIPMKLDAFYVSMLSEKYMNNKVNLSTAFKMGLKSNKWAKENNNNYSSLIYVIQKV